MMRRLLVALVLLSLVGCGGPEQIPQKKMEKIIREIFIANAYVGAGNFPFRSDSMTYYAPIFKAYGYTPEDFDYTLGKMALRKSSKIPEVFANVVANLQKEFDVLDYQKHLADTLIQLINRKYQDTIFELNHKELRTISEANRFQLEFPTKIGSYELSFRYAIDSLDQNESVRLTTQLLTAKDSTVRSAYNYFSRLPNQYFKTSISVTDSVVATIKYAFYDRYAQENKRPAMVFDSVLILYIPPFEESRARIIEDLTGFRPQVYKIYRDVKNQKDSFTRGLVPPMAVTKRDSLLR